MFWWSRAYSAVAGFGTANFDSLAMMPNQSTPSFDLLPGTTKRNRIIFGEVAEFGNGA